MVRQRKTRAIARGSAHIPPAKSRSWSPIMYLNPGGDTPGFTFSVLRRRLRETDVAVSAAEFVRRKLYPIDAPPDGLWDRPFTCLRHDVLLPPGAVDEFMNVERLLLAYERHLLSWRNGLLCVLKIAQPMDEPVQASYERIRVAVRASFALRRNCPAVLVCHAPFLAGAPGRLHCHVIALTAELGLLGFGTFNDEITSDEGHLTLYEEFRTVGAIASSRR